MLLATRLKRIEKSQTTTISAMASAMKRRGVDVVNLSVGEPDFNTPEHICNSAIDAMRKGLTKYTPVEGMPELLDAIARKLKRDSGLEYHRDEIIVSCGAKHSIFNIVFAITDRGDDVIIPSPYWVSYAEQVKMANGRPIIVHTYEGNGFKLTPEVFKRHLTGRTKYIILNNPSNPTGSVYTEDELKKLAEIIVEKNLYCISDEIYEKLVYEPAKHFSIASFGKEIKERTFIVNGVSKAYAMTGWRIGYTAGKSEVIEAMNVIQGQMTTNATSIAQYAAIAALDGPQDCVESMRLEFKKRRDYVLNRINQIKGLTCSSPEGAFYVFPNFSKFYGTKFGGREIKDSLSMCAYLLEECKVACVPGSAFGADDYIRISYATSMENIKKGFDRIEEGLNKLL